MVQNRQEGASCGKSAREMKSNVLICLAEFKRVAPTRYELLRNDFHPDEELRQGRTPESRATITFDSVLTPELGLVVRFVAVGWAHLQGPSAHSFVLGFVCRSRAPDLPIQCGVRAGLPHWSRRPARDPTTHLE